MSAFDKIIGYSAIKKELRQISDTLKNKDVYAGLGVSAPKGLLLYGEPGVGKSLMASAIIEESGRKVFTCRKDKPNGAFVKEIKATFDKAAENAPSIVYLDDMDKFTNGDERHPDAEEYVTVQSCIDEVKGSVAVYNEEKEELTIFAVNRTLEDDIELTTDLRGMEGFHLVEHIVMEESDLKLVNSSYEEKVVPKTVNRSKMDGGIMTTLLGKASWNVIRLSK